MMLAEWPAARMPGRTLSQLSQISDVSQARSLGSNLTSRTIAPGLVRPPPIDAQKWKQSKESRRGSALAAKSAGGRKPKKRQISILSAGDLEDEEPLPKDMPPHREQNGWQNNHTDVLSRMRTLFNCHTLSDIVFHAGTRQIPAHRFVLAGASPVFYDRICEGGFKSEVKDKFWRPSFISDGDMTPQSLHLGMLGSLQPVSVKISIDYEYDSFFEFLRFIYTDQVAISLKNVVGLVLVADDFRVDCLVDRCINFLRAEVKPENAFRILSIAKLLMCKAMIGYWREFSDHAKRGKKFKELTLTERKLYMQEARSRASSRAVSRKTSVCSTVSYRSMEDGRRPSRFSSRRPSEDRQSIGGTSIGTGAYGSEFGDVDGQVPPDHHDVLTAGAMEAARQLQSVALELHSKCWKCIREQTHIVLSGEDWVNQSVHTVKDVLKMDMCSVPEIALFRALNVWIEHRCRQQGLALVPGSRRMQVPADFIELIRFPTMSIEELQWEVVPTGLLPYEDLNTLQLFMSKDPTQPTRFIAEERDLPMADYLERSKRRKAAELRGEDTSDADEALGKSLSMRAARYVPPNAVYKASTGDEVDALLGARLWRKHVDHIVQESREEMWHGMAEAHTGQKENNIFVSSSPRNRHQQESDKPMLLQEKTLNADLPVFLKKTLGSVGRAPPQAVPHITVPLSVPGGTMQPSDFKRIETGLYRCRDSTVVEMKIENGDPMVYEHAGLADEDGDGLSDFGDDSPSTVAKCAEEARTLIGIPSTTRPGRGTPLDAFLAKR